MNNLFILNEDEKKRILNLHESATKRQYLNEQGVAFNTTDQSTSSYSQQENNANDYVTTDYTKGQITFIQPSFEFKNASSGGNLKIFKGVVFGPSSDYTDMIAKNVLYQITGEYKDLTGDIYYGCSTGKFNIKGNYNQYFIENKMIRDVFDNVCKKLPEISKTSQLNTLTPGDATKTQQTQKTQKTQQTQQPTDAELDKIYDELPL